MLNTFYWCKDILKTEIWCRHWRSWLSRVENRVKASCAMGTWTTESAFFSRNKSNGTLSIQTKRRGTTKLLKRNLLNEGTTDMQYIPIQLPCETQESVFKCSRTSGVWLDMGLFWARLNAKTQSNLHEARCDWWTYELYMVKWATWKA